MNEVSNRDSESVERFAWTTIVYDENCVIVDILQPNYTMLLHLAPQELIGLNVDDLCKVVPKCDVEVTKYVASIIRRVASEKNQQFFEYETGPSDNKVHFVCYAERLNNGYTYAQVQAVDIHNLTQERGKFISDVIKNASHLLASDNSAIKHRLEDLNNENRYLELAIEAGEICTWIYNKAQQVFKLMHGHLLIGEQLTLEQLLELLYDYDKKVLMNTFQNVIQGRLEHGNIELRFLENGAKHSSYYRAYFRGMKENGDVKYIIGSLEDITKERIKQQELESLNMANKLIMQASGVSVWRLVLPSKKFYSLNGDMLVGKNSSFEHYMYHVVHSDDRDKLLDVYEQFFSGKISQKTVLFRVIDPEDKSVKYISNVMAAVYGASGKLKSIVGTHKDVSEEHKRRLRLEDYERKTNLIINACKIVQWDYDLKTKTIHTYTSEAILPNVDIDVETYLKYVHPDDVEHMRGLFKRLDRHDKDDSDISVRLRLPGYDSYRNVILNGVSVVDEFGKITKYTGLRRDVTDWITMQERLSDTIQQLEKLNHKAKFTVSLLNNIIEKVPLAIFIKDVDNEYRYVLVNEQLALLHNNSIENIVGKNDYELYPKDIADIFRNEDNDAINHKGTPYIALKRISTGISGIYETTEAVFTSVDGRQMLVGVVQNVTLREQSKLELQQAKEAAEQSDKLKSAFLANMSHEIRTPLNAIVGFSELLTETEDSDEKNEYCKIINNNSEILLRLIEDILDLSKVEAGIVQFKKEKFDIVPYFDALTKSLSQRLTNPDIEYIVENPYDEYITYCDKNRFAQVVTNFVTNAIKYTVKGYIRVGYIEENNGIKIYVEDTGIGIAESKKNKVFQRFEKLDEFAQGTGLGLSICKAIVEMDNGKIGFESKEGEGSYFWAWNPKVKRYIS